MRIFDLQCQGRFGESAELVRRAHAKYPGVPQIQLAEVQQIIIEDPAHADAKRLERAKTLIRKATSGDDTDPPTLVLGALLAFDLDDYRAAFELSQRAAPHARSLTDERQLAQFAHMLGSFAWWMAQQEGPPEAVVKELLATAEEQLKNALATDPHEPRYAPTLAEFLRAQGRHDEAAQLDATRVPRKPWPPVPRQRGDEHPRTA